MTWMTSEGVVAPAVIIEKGERKPMLAIFLRHKENALTPSSETVAPFPRVKRVSDRIFGWFDKKCIDEVRFCG